MDWSDILHKSFMTLYTFILAMVAMYGFHRYVIVYLYYKHRNNVPRPAGTFDEQPRVTIQLPMYNESAVAQRIIERVCQIEYPKDKLQIQVLDDSTDDTCQIAMKAVEAAAAEGFDIEYIHRDNREGFKAGALSNGLKTATGEFVSIFDADFYPGKDFLLRSVPYFTDPKVCVVQTRWDHLNRQDSMLTRSQAILLDGHFAIEHVARNRSDRFISFNGTAGTWRRAAIDDAGGWHCDTLTEDLDLSYRAQLKGWTFVFLPELASPAELPPEMNAFKAQQFRWTKGGAQTALKLLSQVMKSSASLKIKIESFFHLTGFSLHFYLLLLVLLMFPAMIIRGVPLEDKSLWRAVFDLGVFSLATMSAFIFYAASQFELCKDWRSAFKYMPMLIALGVGLSVSNTVAIIEALLGKKSEFVRTPKYGTATTQQPIVASAGPRKRRRKVWMPYVELAMGLYMATCLVLNLVYVPADRAAFAAPFMAIFTFGFFYVSVMSFMAARAGQKAPARNALPAAAKV